MARAVAAQGFAACTIADIVREAAVSRRTFYEHFQTKADCLIAMYESASRNALRQLSAMLDPSRHWQHQVEEAMAAYLGVLADNPIVLRALFIDILSLGTEGLAARRRVNHEIAEFLLSVVNPQRDEAVMSPAMAMAVVGGINELVLQLIEQDRIQDIHTITDTTSALIRAVVGGERL
ncbi:MAG: TetR/AcrR family transcriptional regulator [Rhodoferax sp.]|nr:MAG: TetR/AcrR family transcriptional regulator [Rhodoferax sp.]